MGGKTKVKHKKKVRPLLELELEVVLHIKTTVVLETKIWEKLNLNLKEKKNDLLLELELKVLLHLRLLWYLKLELGGELNLDLRRN